MHVPQDLCSGVYILGVGTQANYSTLWVLGKEDATGEHHSDQMLYEQRLQVSYLS